jgi:hypothetical protein
MPWPETEPLAQASVAAFKQKLGRLGWVKGTNIRIDYRFAKDDPTLIKEYAAELVGMSPDAILASTNPTIAALQQQTHTNYPDCFRARGRSRRVWIRSELYTPWRQHYRFQLLSRADGRKMAATAQGGRAKRYARCRHL